MTELAINDYADESLVDNEPAMNHSWEIATSVAESTTAVQEKFPECLGVTMYGSVARGEANAESDADIFVFMATTERPGSLQVNPAIEQGEMVKRRTEGALEGSHLFHLAVGFDYKIQVFNILQAHGIEKADIDVLPIDEDIIDDSVDYMLEVARQKANGERKEIAAPRNIRGLFHAPVATEQLADYQLQVIDRFTSSEYGDIAWDMTRRMVIGFEKGRDRTSFTDADWRHIPETLEDARRVYMPADGGEERL